MTKPNKQTRTRWSVVDTAKLHDRVKVYQHKKRLKSHAEATRLLIERGLEAERAQRVQR